MLAQEQVLGLAATAQPQSWASRKGQQWHQMPPPTSAALRDLTDCSSSDQTHSKTSYISEANLGLGFWKKKKPKQKQKNPQNQPNKNPELKKKIQWELKLVPIKNKWVNTGASAAPKSPSTAEPQQDQHKLQQELLTEGPQLCSPLVATQRGLLVPAWSTQLATASSLHLPAPAPPAALPGASQRNTTAVTQQKELVPDIPSPSLSICAHQHLPFCYLAPKG